MVRAMLVCGHSLAAIAIVADRPRPEVDVATWALLGRTSEAAAAELNVAIAKAVLSPLMRDRILARLRLQTATSRDISAWLRLDETAATLALRELALEGVVDAIEAPPPAGPREMRWYAIEGALPCR